VPVSWSEVGSAWLGGVGLAIIILVGKCKILSCRAKSGDDECGQRK
jgi:hypothetical protein